MRYVCLASWICAAALAAQSESQPPDARTWIGRGVQEFKAARYSDAVEDFQHAVALDPSNLNAHLYLGAALIVQYIPGAQNADNLAIADKARAEFEQVLKLSADDQRAIYYLAALDFQEAGGITDPADKNRHLDSARAGYLKLLAAEPRNKEILYTLGSIDWMQWYHEWKFAIDRAGMKPEDERPIPGADIRLALKAHLHLVEDGMANLQKAIDIDPQYVDALTYMNLFVRERASLDDTMEQYKADIATADDWVAKAMQAKKAKGAAEAPAAPAPEAAPVKPSTPARIRVGGNVQARNLVRKVVPRYPEEARRAGIQGIVRFQVTIGKDGLIQDLQLVSGDPALVQAAKDAVQQWVYKPTLLNGQPVEVLTVIDVNFTLSQ